MLILMLTAAAVILVINVASSILKRWIYPKFGRTGVQVTVYAISLIGALYYSFSGQIEGLKKIVEASLSIFSLSVTFYEVVLSRFRWFKGLPRTQK